MKKALSILLSLFTICTFCSCSNGIESEKNVVKNTIGLSMFYNNETMTCTLGASIGFNYEEITIPNYMELNGQKYRVTGINANQSGANKNICKDFLKGNKFIRKITIENDYEYFNSLPYDVFRDSTLEYADLSKFANLKVIGDHVFTNSALKEISLPSSLEKTYKGVFSSTKLKSVEFPSSYKEMDIDLFFNCKELEYVNFNTGLKKISGSCFEKTPSLKEVIAPNIEIIEQHAFRETPLLTTFNFEKVKSLGYMSFYKTGIKEVNLNDVYLENECFRESKIETLRIKSATEIPFKAFCDCNNLKEAVLPSNLKALRSSSFKNTSITSVNLPVSLSVLESEVFYNCSKLENVILSPYLVSISTNCFRKCKALKEINFPSSIQRIYDGAFMETSLSSVSISKDVTLLGQVFDKKCQVNYI